MREIFEYFFLQCKYLYFRRQSKQEPERVPDLVWSSSVTGSQITNGDIILMKEDRA